MPQLGDEFALYYEKYSTPSSELVLLIWSTKLFFSEFAHLIREQIQLKTYLRKKLILEKITWISSPIRLTGGQHNWLCQDQGRSQVVDRAAFLGSGANSSSAGLRCSFDCRLGMQLHSDSSQARLVLLRSCGLSFLPSPFFSLA